MNMQKYKKFIISKFELKYLTTNEVYDFGILAQYTSKI